MTETILFTEIFTESNLKFTFSIVIDVDGHISSWQHCALYIPDGSTTLLCPKLFLMTSDLISLEVLMGFTFSTAMLLALLHVQYDRSYS